MAVPPVKVFFEDKEKDEAEDNIEKYFAFIFALLQRFRHKVQKRPADQPAGGKTDQQD